MAGQLDAIIDASANSNVTVRILPYKVGAHPALESDFTMLEFAGLAPSVVYVEGLVGQIYLDRPQDAERYVRVFEHLCIISLSPEDSIDLIADLRTAYKGASRMTG